VARDAPVRPDDRMLIHKGSSCLRVALGADRILIGCGFELIGKESAVSVMAVATLDQTFVHPVMERHVERWLYIGVTFEAEGRLCGDQQRCIRRRLMNAVAAEAAYSRLGMGGTEEVGVSVRVAAQASRIDLFSRELAQADDLGDIATGIHMGLAGAVTTLTRCTSFAMHQRQFGMGVVGHSPRLGIMAKHASVIANKFGWVRQRLARQLLHGLG
jgi:hypothetical protein